MRGESVRGGSMRGESMQDESVRWQCEGVRVCFVWLLPFRAERQRPVGAGTTPDLRQNAVLSKRAAASTALGQGSPCKEGWKPWFPRAFLVTFTALGKSYPSVTGQGGSGVGSR